MEFRKSNEAIGLRVKEGRLSLLSRKLYNVMVYHAQQLKTPGLNAPIETEAAKKYFWIRLADVARDASYDSNDTELLKQHIEEFHNIKIHLEDDRQWTSERLISSVKIVNPAGLGKKGGTVWVGFAFPPEVHELVMSPGTYTKLSIYYQGLLRSGTSLALYEICRRYATNPSKLTSIAPFDYWYSVLTGNPVREEPPEYKYFKRDVLKPAIAEINSATDIHIELIEHKNGRRIDRLQFHVELNRQQSLDFPPKPPIDTGLIAKIMQFGFSKQDATDLTAQYSDEKLRASLALVETRVKAKNSAPLDSPAAYFRWSLKQNTVPSQAVTSRPSRAAQVEHRERPSLMDQFLAARGREAGEIYAELNEIEQADVMNRFWHSPYATGMKPGRRVESPMIRAALGQWYAKELWGEPTAESLANFVDKMHLVG